MVDFCPYCHVLFSHTAPDNSLQNMAKGNDSQQNYNDLKSNYISHPKKWIFELHHLSAKPKRFNHWELKPNTPYKRKFERLQKRSSSGPFYSNSFTVKNDLEV